MSGGGRIIEHASAEVVLIRVNNKAAAQNTVRPGQGDNLVLELKRSHATGVGLDITEVADVARLVVWSSVCFLLRIVVGAQASTSLPQISFLVDVEPVLMSARVVPLETSDEAFDSDSTVLMLNKGDIPGR